MTAGCEGTRCSDGGGADSSCGTCTGSDGRAGHSHTAVKTARGNARRTVTTWTIEAPEFRAGATRRGADLREWRVRETMSSLVHDNAVLRFKGELAGDDRDPERIHINRARVVQTCGARHADAHARPNLNTGHGTARSGCPPPACPRTIPCSS